MQLVKQGPKGTGGSTLRVTIEGFPEMRFTANGKRICVFWAVGFSYRSLRFEVWENVDNELQCDELVQLENHTIEVTGYTKIYRFTNSDGDDLYHNMFVVKGWKDVCDAHGDRVDMPNLGETG